MNREKETIDVVLEENPQENRLFPDYSWRIIFQCPYCHEQAKASFSEKLLQQFENTYSVISYVCDCQAWAGFRVITLPKTFEGGKEFTIYTPPPQLSP